MAIIILLSSLICVRISAHFSNSEERRPQRGTGSALSHATPSSLNYDVTHNLILSQVRFFLRPRSFTCPLRDEQEEGEGGVVGGVDKTTKHIHILP